MFFLKYFFNLPGAIMKKSGRSGESDSLLGLTITFFEPDIFLFKIWPRIQWTRSDTPEHACFWDNWTLVLKNRSFLRPRCGSVSKYLEIIFSLIVVETSCLKYGYFTFCCFNVFYYIFIWKVSMFFLNFGLGKIMRADVTWRSHYESLFSLPTIWIIGRRFQSKQNS